MRAKMETVYYIYKFEDGTVLTLVNTGFSIAEGSKMKELHGDCELEIKQVRINYE
jgi:hypothetical protein